MAYVFRDSGLAQGITQAGSALGSALQQRGKRAFDLQQIEAAQQQKKDLEQAQRTRQSETSRIIQEGMANLGPDATFEDRISVLGDVVSQTGDVDTVKEYGALYSSLQKAQPKGVASFEGQSEEELKDTFMKFGIGEEASARYAALYPTLSTGGKTDFARHLFDQIERSQDAGNLFGAGLQPGGGLQTGGGGQQLPGQQPQGEEFTGLEAEETFQYPEVNPFENQTSKERADTQKTLGIENAPVAEKVGTDLNGFKKAGRSITQLTSLNNRGNLPTGAKKLFNVNLKSGDLRFTGAANSDTQLFVKTVNEFIKGAKDSFGARVTNFELDKFLQGLPTLANSPEGRRVILKQMEVVNKLDQLEKKSLLDVYRHYGRGKIDNIRAREISEQSRVKQEERLIEEFYRAPEEHAIYTAKKNTPPGKVAIEVQGQYGYLTKQEAQIAVSKGARLL